MNLLEGLMEIHWVLGRCQGVLKGFRGIKGILIAFLIDSEAFLKVTEGLRMSQVVSRTLVSLGFKDV